VQKLDDSGKADGTAIFAACVTRGKKQESGTHAFPSAAEQVFGDFGNRRKGGIALARQLLLDQKKVVADEIKNLFGREQRDGLSPA